MIAAVVAWKGTPAMPATFLILSDNPVSPSIVMGSAGEKEVHWRPWQEHQFDRPTVRPSDCGAYGVFV